MTVYRVRYGHQNFEHQARRDFVCPIEASKYAMHPLRYGASIEKIEVLRATRWS